MFENHAERLKTATEELGQALRLSTLISSLYIPPKDPKSLTSADLKNMKVQLDMMEECSQKFRTVSDIMKETSDDLRSIISFMELIISTNEGDNENE